MLVCAHMHVRARACACELAERWAIRMPAVIHCSKTILLIPLCTHARTHAHTRAQPVTRCVVAVNVLVLDTEVTVFSSLRC